MIYNKKDVDEYLIHVKEILSHVEILELYSILRSFPTQRHVNFYKNKIPEKMIYTHLISIFLELNTWEKANIIYGFRKIINRIMHVDFKLFVSEARKCDR